MPVYVRICVNFREFVSLTYRPTTVSKLAGFADGSDQSHYFKYNSNANHTVFRTCKFDLFFFHDLLSPICGASASRRADRSSVRFLIHEVGQLLFCGVTIRCRLRHYCAFSCPLLHLQVFSWVINITFLNGLSFSSRFSVTFISRYI